MTYEEALAWLYARRRTGERGTHRVRALLARLGHRALRPQFGQAFVEFGVLLEHSHALVAGKPHQVGHGGLVEPGPRVDGEAAVRGQGVLVGARLICRAEPLRLAAGEIDAVYVVHSHFKSAVSSPAETIRSHPMSASHSPS